MAINQSKKCETWIALIDNYQLSNNNEEKIQKLSESDETILYGRHANTVQQKEAREAFLRHLSDVLNNGERNDSRKKKAITLEDLLGEEGVRLYKAAIREENASHNFRKAVFSESMTHFDGPRWRKKLILWIGGPSGSGKSTGIKNAIRKMSAEILEFDDQNNEGNDVISVDGGVERKLSQMRQMVLEVALSKGYKGIEDLHSNTKLSVKKDIRKLAISNDKFNVVIPATFTSGLKKAAMKRYEKIDNVVHVFAEVRAPGDSERLEDTVFLMANARAWDQSDKPLEEDEIKMNNTEIECESKKPEPEYFKWGKIASKMARKIYLNIAKDPIYILIQNDLIAVKKQEDRWTRCFAKRDVDTPEKKLINQNDFANYKKYLKGKMRLPAIIRAEKLTKTIMRIEKRHPNIEGDKKPKRIFARYEALKKEREVLSQYDEDKLNEIEKLDALNNDGRPKKDLEDWLEVCRKHNLLVGNELMIERHTPKRKKLKKREQDNKLQDQIKPLNNEKKAEPNDLIKETFVLLSQIEKEFPPEKDRISAIIRQHAREPYNARDVNKILLQIANGLQKNPKLQMMVVEKMKQFDALNEIKLAQEVYVPKAEKRHTLTMGFNQKKSPSSSKPRDKSSSNKPNKPTT